MSDDTKAWPFDDRGQTARPLRPADNQPQTHNPAVQALDDIMAGQRALLAERGESRGDGWTRPTVGRYLPPVSAFERMLRNVEEKETRMAEMLKEAGGDYAAVPAKFWDEWEDAANYRNMARAAFLAGQGENAG